MMNLQIVQGAAFLAPPTISFEYPLAKQIVIFGTELQSRSLVAEVLHVPFKIPRLEH